MIYGTFVEAQGEFARQITFLARAVYKDRNMDMDVRLPQYILIEPSDIESDKFRGVSTDGRRLHLVDPLFFPDGIGVEPGLWRPLKRGGETSWMAQIKSDEKRFPNYRKVIPTNKPAFEFELPGLPRGDLVYTMAYLVELFRKFPEPTSINWNYLNALDHYRVWKVKWYEPNKAVLFESDNYTAVIMPQHMSQHM